MSYGLVEEPTMNGGFGEAVLEGIAQVKLDVTSEFASDSISQMKSLRTFTAIRTSK